MNRALRKRASKLHTKAKKALAKLQGHDLQSVANRLSEEQYVETLARFVEAGSDDAEALATALARSLIGQTEDLVVREVPRFASPEQLAKVACQPGCSWCCRQPMQVSILSAISVAAYLLDQDRAVASLQELNQYALAIEPFGRNHLRLKESFEPCPFLNSEQQCTVYEARPVICRAFHSTDVDSCRRVVEQREKVRDVPMYTPLFGFTGMRLSGARRALKDLGLDDRPVVLALAVRLLLQDFSGTVGRWLQGELVFDEAAVVS